MFLLFATGCLKVVIELLFEFLPLKCTSWLENLKYELLQKGKIPL